MKRTATPALATIFAGAVVLVLLAAGIYASFSPAPGAPMAGAIETPPAKNTSAKAEEPMTPEKTADLQVATFGSGCFWCTEAVFQELKGVQTAVSGYTGGDVLNPTYEQICTGETGHAEVVQVTYDPALISFAELLEVFWKTHDPTTPNQQGHDIGTQYRSAVFFHSDEQRTEAAAYKEKLDASGAFPASIVTEITAATKFYPAEDYHQKYFENNGRQPYCMRVIRPKLDKLREVFADKLK